jgi:phospholipid/cholesterol/gamma-HCH transport system substrate-binding protein
MKETLNTVRVGLFFLLGLAVIWIVYETLQQGRLFAEDTYPIYGQFGDVKMLRSGDDVRVSGVRVGRVSQVRLRNGMAEAVLDIDEKVRISRDSVATIAVSSMLGGNHVAIDMGKAEELLAPGDRIATRHTADLNEVFAQLGEVAGRVDSLFDDIGAVLGAITGTPEEPGALQNFNAILQENREALQATIENVREITDKVNHGEGTIARLINDDTAYQNLMATVEEITKAAEQAASLMNDGAEMMAHIRSGEGTLGNLIYGEDLGREVQAMTSNLREVSERLAKGEGTLGRLLVDDTLFGEIQAVAANLREVSDRLAKGEGTIGRLLVDDTLYRDIQGVVQRAERALEGLNEQGPITAVGVAAGALF